MAKGYKFYDKNGQTYAIDKNTGEILETVNPTLPVGTIAYTPQQQEAYKKRKELEHQKDIRRAMLNGMGHFYFILHDDLFDGLKPESTIRLIVLLTYLGYGNKLMRTQKTPMQFKDLQNILMLSKGTINSFWREVCPRFLAKDEHTNEIIVKTNNIFRGRIKDNQKGQTFEKFYIDAIRQLYKSTPKNNHRYLGFVLKLLPFTNIEYNMLCMDPHEKNLENIEHVRLDEFCDLIGYDIAHVTRLLNIYRKLRFPVNTQDGVRYERFVSFVNDGLDRLGSRIFVNPRIFYAGSDYTKVEVLGAFYVDKPKNQVLNRAKTA